MTSSVEYINKLRNSGLRPTKQRIKICEVLFNREKTFHFSINDLMKIIQDYHNEKISLATIYNTVHSFKKKGYLKEINIEKWRIANYEHPFVLGIGDGTLQLNKFQYYLKQDYVFLINYCKVLALAASKSSSENMMKRWVGLLNETLNSENPLSGF